MLLEVPSTSTPPRTPQSPQPLCAFVAMTEAVVRSVNPFDTYFDYVAAFERSADYQSLDRFREWLRYRLAQIRRDGYTSEKAEIIEALLSHLIELDQELGD